MYCMHHTYHSQKWNTNLTQKNHRQKHIWHISDTQQWHCQQFSQSRITPTTVLPPNAILYSSFLPCSSLPLLSFTTSLPIWLYPPFSVPPPLPLFFLLFPSSSSLPFLSRGQRFEKHIENVRKREVRNWNDKKLIIIRKRSKEHGKRERYIYTAEERVGGCLVFLCCSVNAPPLLSGWRTWALCLCLTFSPFFFLFFFCFIYLVFLLTVSYLTEFLSLYLPPCSSIYIPSSIHPFLSLVLSLPLLKYYLRITTNENGEW